MRLQRAQRGIEEWARQSKKQGANHNDAYRNTGVTAAKEMKLRMGKTRGKRSPLPAELSIGWTAVM
jgi:hypothetical protein